MVTALDVAAAAGVSKTTVSYVFSPEKANLISEKTRQKVLSAAEDLGYQPCYLGRSLSAQCSYNVALVLPSRCGKSMSSHMLEIFHGIIQSSENSEYNLNIFLGGGKRLDVSLRSHRMDGVIAVGLGSDNKLLEHIASFKLPMVVVNRFFPVNKYTGCVRADMSQWVLDEIAALKQLQCNNILVLNKSSNSDAGREIAAALENITKQSSNQVDMITMSDNLLPQLLNLLHPVLQYDGFIINGSEGNLLQQLATQLDIPQSRLTISHFSSTRKPDIGGRSWYRNGHTMGVQGWELLHDMLTGRSEGREIRLPVVSTRQHLRAKSNSEYGFDL